VAKAANPVQNRAMRRLTPVFYQFAHGFSRKPPAGCPAGDRGKRWGYAGNGLTF